MTIAEIDFADKLSLHVLKMRGLEAAVAALAETSCNPNMAAGVSYLTEALRRELEAISDEMQALIAAQAQQAA